MEFGLYSLSDLVTNPHTGVAISARQRIEETIAAARLADEAGLDVFGVGEHHRLDFAVSSPAVVMAAIAAQTRKIRLTSAVTVLSAADPVRVFEDFSTLDLVSGGRAEIMAGRGVFLEPFPLFGCALEDYDALFAEKFALLRQLGREQRVSWRGRFRPPLSGAEISPRPVQAELPIWIGVGGSPESAIRAGSLGAPMALAVLGGPIGAIRQTVDLYREGARRASIAPSKTRVALTNHMHLGVTSQGARAEFYPYYSQYWAEASPRGRQSTRISQAQFAAAAAPGTALLVGSTQEVVEKILAMHEVTRFDRLLAQLDIGGQPYRDVARMIEQFANEVVPAVKAAIGVTAKIDSLGETAPV
jgi:alkanesulfonate monooxygenase SsuD/methylene tetrahydromethanopterin reductase-like flavin-dependent oxidoreductase (luciferase family)